MNTALSQVKNANYSLMPTNFQEMMQFADIVAKSDLAPKDYKHKPGNVMLAVQLGMEIGLQPMASIQNIAVINGRPSLWGDAMLAVVRGSGQLEAFKEFYNEETQTQTCEVKRRGYAPAIVFFSVDDAKKAGLWGKAGPWSTYPKRMMQMRARGFALRDSFTDILKGVQSAEEQTDIVEPSHQFQEVAKPKTTVSKLLEGGDHDPATDYDPELKKRVEDNKTLFDHQGFEQIRDLFISEPEKMKIITKRENIDRIADLPIKFFDAIILGMKPTNLAMEETNEKG